MSIRFAQSDARSMGRDTTGVRGIRLKKDDVVIGMILADPAMSLLTVCENGFGKRTAIGVGGVPVEDVAEADPENPTAEVVAEEEVAVPEDEAPDDDSATDEAEEAESGDEVVGSSSQYRRQKRGGKGVKDIKVTKRNGNAVKILAVTDQDEVLMVTASGKIQRIRAGDINEIGRNTQGVRIIRLEESDKLVSMACIPAALVVDVLAETPTAAPATPDATTPDAAGPPDAPDVPAAE
jgi:DNA gyrase subunit A